MVGFQLMITSTSKKSDKSEDLLNLQSVVRCAIFCGLIQHRLMAELQAKEEPLWDSVLISAKNSLKPTAYVLIFSIKNCWSDLMKSNNKVMKYIMTAR
jgi:hypothetical protein